MYFNIFYNIFNLGLYLDLFHDIFRFSVTKTLYKLLLQKYLIYYY